MNFKFTLQAVLDARHSKVEALEIQLGQLNHIKQQLEMFIQSLYERLEDMFAEIKHQQQLSEMDIFTVMHLHENIAHTKERIQQAKEDLKLLEQRIEAKRKELVQARQDEEVMEILKEKEFQRLVEQIAIADGRMLDDIYIARAFRMSKENKRDASSAGSAKAS